MRHPIRSTTSLAQSASFTMQVSASLTSATSSGLLSKKFRAARALLRAALESTRRERQHREAQMALAHANRVATMGHLTASIAHEIKQPIATVRGDPLLASAPHVSVEQMLAAYTSAGELSRGCASGVNCFFQVLSFTCSPSLGNGRTSSPQDAPRVAARRKSKFRLQRRGNAQSHVRQRPER
jgi:signal transduction histidine kinase